MPHNRWLGWDLGGAHLKAVQLGGDGVEAVLQVPCPLWQGLDHLDRAIDVVLRQLGPRATRHAVTMTGEVADVFEDRAQGVRALVERMQTRFAGEQIQVYAGRAGFLEPGVAAGAAELVASVNWLASATLAATRCAEGLLVDIGSTTTDLLPFSAGQVIVRGHTDYERLAAGELVYRGVVRTPMMALTRRVPFGGHWVPLMAEHFATTADIYRLTGDLPGHADLMPSADGRAKTVPASAARLARMVGLDASAADPSAWQRLARHLAEVQLRTLADACETLLARGELTADAPLLGAGVGRFLVRQLAARLGRTYLGFATLFEGEPICNVDVADCAPAVAVARLALEQCT